MSLAPILLFVYNRKEHVERVLTALSVADLAQASELIIYSDGPKGIDDKATVEEVRALLRSRQWCKTVKIVEREQNLGLARNIIDGVTTVIHTYGKVIVLESDTVVSRGFLQYMNAALDLYANEEKVMHISGYIYPYRSLFRPRNETYFLRIFSCWGWATWKRAWDYYEADTALHLSRLDTPEKIKDFTIEGHSDTYVQLLNNQQGIINTWAVKWYASWWHRGGYSLFPRYSLVQNIGHDGSGRHSVVTHHFKVKTTDTIRVQPVPIKEQRYIRHRVDLFYKKIYHTRPLLFRMKKRTRQFFGNDNYEALKIVAKLFIDPRQNWHYLYGMVVMLILLAGC